MTKELQKIFWNLRHAENRWQINYQRKKNSYNCLDVFFGQVFSLKMPNKSNTILKTAYFSPTFC